MEYENRIKQYKSNIRIEQTLEQIKNKQKQKLGKRAI